MKTIELTDEQYELLLVYKNYITTRVHGITNNEALHILEANKERENKVTLDELDSN